MSKKTKVKTTKKPQIKQKQKQHQRQTVIVNVNTKKSSNSKKRGGGQGKTASQPLITTLPISYTPYTMYDLSNVRNQDANDGRYINQPEIQNAIPVMDIQIPNVNNTFVQPISATTKPFQKYDGVVAGDNNDTADADAEDERLYQLKLQDAQNISNPTQNNILRSIQGEIFVNKKPFTTPKKNKGITDDDDEITNNVNPLQSKKYHCEICGSNVKDDLRSISAHNRTNKHINAELRRLAQERELVDERTARNAEARRAKKNAKNKKDEQKDNSDTSVGSIQSPAFKSPPPPSEAESESGSNVYYTKNKKTGKITKRYR
jgi:hypothetical protein